jgi:hypothetical protein
MDRVPATPVRSSWKGGVLLMLFGESGPGKGVNNMATKSLLRVGIVTLVSSGLDSWRLRYRDQKGRDVRRRLRGLSKPEVLAVAAHVSQEALADKEYLPGKKRESAVPGIEEAIEEALRLGRMRRAGSRRAGSRRAGSGLRIAVSDARGQTCALRFQAKKRRWRLYGNRNPQVCPRAEPGRGRVKENNDGAAR